MSVMDRHAFSEIMPVEPVMEATPAPLSFCINSWIQKQSWNPVGLFGSGSGFDLHNFSGQVRVLIHTLRIDIGLQVME